MVIARPAQKINPQAPSERDNELATILRHRIAARMIVNVTPLWNL
jgi:hypothetical protein